MATTAVSFTQLPFATLDVTSLSRFSVQKGVREKILQDRILIEIFIKLTNHHIGTIIRILVCWITKKGFTIEARYGDSIVPITDPFHNTSLYEHWKKIIPEVVVQLLAYGLVVINKRFHPGRPKPYDVELQVMDLATEVWVKITFDKEERRSYTAYFRQSVDDMTRQKPTELVDATIYVMNKPTFEGVVTSQMRECLDLCANLEGRSIRREMQDARATWRERIYYLDLNQKSAIATEDEINVANAAQYTMPSANHRMTNEIRREFVPTRPVILPGSMEHVEGQIKRGNAFFQEQHEKHKEGKRPERLSRVKFNYQLNRWTEAPELRIFEPDLALDQFRRLENSPDYTFVNSNYVQEYEMIARHMATRLGIPVEWALGLKAGISSETESSTEQFKATVDSWQRELELLISQVFLESYGRSFLSGVEDEFTAAAFETHAQNRAKRQKLRQEKRKERVQEDGSVGAESEVEEEGDEPETKFFLTEDELSQVMETARIAVHFHENPVLTLQTIGQLRTDGYLTRENAGRLAFEIVGLHESMLATEADLLKEAKFKRKITEIETPEDQTKKPDAAPKGKGEKKTEKPSKPDSKAS